MSKKSKFKVCKTDLGMDKVYPEGSVVDLDDSELWVMGLVESGNLVNVETKFEAETEGVGQKSKVKKSKS